MYGDRKITIAPLEMSMQLKHTTVFLTGLATLLLLTASGCKKSATETDEQLRKAQKLIAQGNYEEAFMQLNQVLAEAPKDPNVHLNLGWLYLYTDDPQKAESEWSKAQALAPDLAEVLHLKGALYNYKAQQEQAQQPGAAKKDYEQAIQLFKDAIARDQKNYHTYFDLASSLTALDHNEDAVDALDKGFDFIPKADLNTQVNFQIATCAAHAKLQMYDEAIADCRQAEEFTNSLSQKQRIEDMIENMKLMNPGLNTKAPTEEPPPSAEEAKSEGQSPKTEPPSNDAASD
jgi:tetratricopeptide (TPR) repeat protein